MRVWWLIFPAVLGACQTGAESADLPTTPVGASDTLVARDLAPGVAYRKFVDRAAPNVMYLVRVDLRRTELELRHVRALDQLAGREKTSDMARRVGTTGVTVLAAVNGDFFSPTGENENNQVIGGEWWKGVQVSESTFDTFDNAHAQFGTDASGRPLMDRFVLDGKAWAHGTLTAVASVNSVPPGSPSAATLYTRRYGATTPVEVVRQVTEVPLIAAGRRADTILYVRRGAMSSVSGSAIPVSGAVLVAYGSGTSVQGVRAMADGDTVKILLSTLPRPGSGLVPALLIGGWPQIVRDGVNIAGQSATLEGTISSNTNNLHPRSAVGFSRDSTTLFLLVVDGRSTLSVGVTTQQLGDLFLRLGAWHAMNFDGGGSTTMVVNGAVVNAPSDPTGERPVGNALLVVSRP
jgi:hypothetical protein